MTESGTWVPPGPSKKMTGRPSCSMREGREAARGAPRRRRRSSGPRVTAGGVAILAGSDRRRPGAVRRSLIWQRSAAVDDGRATTARLSPDPVAGHVSARDPRHRDVAPVPRRPRPAQRLLDEELQAEPRPVARRVRRAPPARRGARPADPDAPSSPTGAAQSRSGITRLIDRLGPRRLGRARSLRDRRPRRRGGPHRRPDSTGCGTRRRPTSRHPPTTSSRRSRPPTSTPVEPRRCATSSRPVEPEPLEEPTGAGRDRDGCYVGTSGFAYPAWSPRFYPAGLAGDGLLRHYGSRLDDVSS